MEKKEEIANFVKFTAVNLTTIDVILQYLAAKTQEKQVVLTLFRPNGEVYYLSEVKDNADHEEVIMTQ